MGGFKCGPGLVIRSCDSIVRGGGRLLTARRCWLLDLDLILDRVTFSA
jgi:hypothetical protein